MQLEYLPVRHRHISQVIDQSAMQLLPNNQVRFLQPIAIDLGGIAKVLQ